MAANLGAEYTSNTLLTEEDKIGEWVIQPGATFTAAPDTATLVIMFELIPAEARLVGELARGRTVEEAAADLGLSVSSARTYLKTVFSKTGVNRQVDLVRLILGSAASFAGAEERSDGPGRPCPARASAT